MDALERLCTGHGKNTIFKQYIRGQVDANQVLLTTIRLFEGEEQTLDI